MQLRKIATLVLVLLMFFSLCSCVQITRRDTADEAVTAYLSEHWPDKDFVPQYHVYLFGSASDFYYRAVSTASPDTWFDVRYKSDVGVIIDNYEEEIERGRQGYHTIERLMGEYKSSINDLLESNEFNGCNADIGCDYNAFLALWEDGVATLDMSFSSELPILWSAEIQFDIESNKPVDSQEAATEVQRAQGILSDAGYMFSPCKFIVDWKSEGESIQLEY